LHALRYCRRVALLSQMIRSVAITGRTDNLNAWFASRQGGRWAEQTVRDAFPTVGPRAQRTPPAVATRPPADPDERLRELTELHERGVLTDAEFEALRNRLRV
jgi:putative oligomerization/nucleic acid binding protein